MTTFPPAAMAGADTEATGKDPEQARLLEISLCLIAPGRDADIRTQIVDPGPDVEVPKEASDIHGLTTERVRAEGKPAAEVLDLYLADMALAIRSGFALVIQNAPYDLTVLQREAVRHGLPTLDERLSGPVAPVIDPLVLDKRCIKMRRRVSKDQGARCLKTLCQVYGFQWDDERAHGAEYDALQAARVVWRIGQWSQKSKADLMAMQLGPFDPPKPMHRNDATAFQSLAGMDLMDLHAKQALWYRQQTEDYGQWLVEQHNEWLAKADTAADDEARAIAEQEAAELDAKVDGLDPHWPVKPIHEKEQ